MNRPPRTLKPAVCLTGDPSLVREIAALCTEKGYVVQQILIREAGRSPRKRFRLVQGIRLVARPSRTIDLALELTTTSIEAKRKNLVLLDRALRPDTTILTSSVTVTLAEQTGWVRYPHRLVGIGVLPSLLCGSLVEFAASDTTAEESRLTAQQFAASLGKEAAFVSDGVGMVLPRILCCLVNEAYYTLREGIATREDIDSAMKLGTHYPAGPLEWGEKIGLRQVNAVMKALYDFYGEDRYRPAPGLSHAAHAAPEHPGM